MNQPLEQTVLFDRGKAGIFCYRIPALLTTSGGAVLAFAEGRRDGADDHGQIALVVKRSDDVGRTWSDLQIVHEDHGGDGITIGNPCPVVDRRNGRILLPMTRDNRQVLLTTSDDDGRTWSPPRDITPETGREAWPWVATGPGVAIQVERGPYAGRLVVPCDLRFTDEKPLPDSHSAALYSDDGGEHWQLGAVSEAGTNEAQAVELDDGRLMLNMRMQRHGHGYRAVATSDDGGQQWRNFHHDDTLVCPIAQASLLRYRWAGEGEPGVLLFANPVPRPADDGSIGHGRHRLTVRASLDDGASWPASRLLREGPSCYSSLARLPDGTLGCLYEAGADRYWEQIVFARLDLAWLLDGRDVEAFEPPAITKR